MSVARELVLCIRGLSDHRCYGLSCVDTKVLRKYLSMVEDAEWCLICVSGGQEYSAGRVAASAARAAFALFPELRGEG